MTPKTKKLLARIKKANNALGVMGAMMISMDLDFLSAEELSELKLICVMRNVSTRDFPKLEAATI